MPNGAHSHAKASAESYEIDTINYLNVGLMVVSIVCAMYLPFETFLFAYAVLGPLHYLTEISWLHDRGYFTVGSRDWMWLVFGALIATCTALTPTVVSPSVAGFSSGVVLVVAAGLAFVSSHRVRWVVLTIGVFVGLVASLWSPLAILFTAFLPTLVHVYVFTGLFVLYGALKSKSRSGFLSLGVFLLAPFVCIFGVATPQGYAPSAYMIEAAAPFDPLGNLALSILGVPVTKASWLGFMRLMGFAYTYHYLNWFSKTRIINWHQVSRRRLTTIVGLYIAALCLYGYNYRWGFLALTFLSIAHVILELPLNFRTIGGILSAIRPILKRQSH